MKTGTPPRVDGRSLDFSKMEAGQLALEIRHFDLSKALEAVINMLAVRAKEKSLHLQLNYQ